MEGKGFQVQSVKNIENLYYEGTHIIYIYSEEEVDASGKFSGEIM